MIALAATLAVSGGALVAVELARADDPSVLWTALVIAKGLLLLVAVALFAHVSWRLWPARIFATTAALPGVQRRFRAVALTLTAIVSLAFVLGAVAGSLPR